MKKTGIIALALSIITTGAYAQGFYFRAGLGYAMPQAGQTMYDTPTPYNEFPTGYSGTRNNTSTTSYQNTINIKGASFSSGLQGTLGLGYMFTPNVGIQLDAALGLSTTKYTFTDNNVYLGSGSGTTAIPYIIQTAQQAKTPVLMMPSLVLQTGGDKVNIYSRFGLALPLNTKITQDQIMTYGGGGTGALTTDDFTWQIKSSFSLGFTAAAGVRYKINDVVSIWGELSLLSMSLNAKQQTLKSWNEDGQSVPLSYYNSAQTIKFSKSANVDSNFNNLPTYSQPFSNIGINVGVAFSLGHHDRRSYRNDNDDIDRTKPYRRR